jgi:hypothetical protein
MYFRERGIAKSLTEQSGVITETNGLLTSAQFRARITYYMESRGIKAIKGPLPTYESP